MRRSTGEELDKDGFVQFPTVIGGVVAVFNIPGIASGQLKLTGDVLADIFNGKITKWNDPKIAQTQRRRDASGLRDHHSGLPFRRIRHDECLHHLPVAGLRQLEKSAPAPALRFSWPAGQGGKGNEGVAALVKQVPNSIGYVEYAYAKQNSIPFAQLQNKNGKYALPENKAFQAAAASADWKSAPGYAISLTNQPGDDRLADHRADLHPRCPKNPEKPEQVAEALKFFDWAFKNGDQARDRP